MFFEFLFQNCTQELSFSNVQKFKLKVKNDTHYALRNWYFWCREPICRLFSCCLARQDIHREEYFHPQCHSKRGCTRQGRTLYEALHMSPDEEKLWIHTSRSRSNRSRKLAPWNVWKFLAWTNCRKLSIQDLPQASKPLFITHKSLVTVRF